MSADDMTPSATVLTRVTVTFGVRVDVPVMTTGAVPVTSVTVPLPPPLSLSPPPKVWRSWLAISTMRLVA